MHITRKIESSKFSSIIDLFRQEINFAVFDFIKHAAGTLINFANLFND